MLQVTDCALHAKYSALAYGRLHVQRAPAEWNVLKTFEHSRHEASDTLESALV